MAALIKFEVFKESFTKFLNSVLFFRLQIVLMLIADGTEMTKYCSSILASDMFGFKK